MKPHLEKTAEALKAARLGKGLSQRALSEKIGTTQARVSNIESGDVDLRLTGLTEFARALDLEVMLVPRQVVPAVRGLIRNLARRAGDGDSPEDAPPLRRAYRLDED